MKCNVMDHTWITEDGLYDKKRNISNHSRAEHMNFA